MNASAPSFVRMFIRFNNRVLLIPGFWSLLSACSGTMPSQDVPLSNNFNLGEEVLRLEKENPAVIKTVEKEGEKETHITTLNWKNELGLFIDPDNKRQRTMEIIYSDSGIISEVFIQKTSANFFIRSHYDLRYFPGRGYTIAANQSVPFLYDENFFIIGKFFVPKEGQWRAALKIPKENEEIPFHFNLIKNNEKYTVEILNAGEKIVCDEVFIKGDSIFISPPVFDSALKGKFMSDTLIEGVWFNYSKGNDYQMPFYAEFGYPERFKIKQIKNIKGPQKIGGKWDVSFNEGTPDYYKAIGLFEPEMKNFNSVKFTGTFLTETGDYRFLDGAYINGELLLSCFDGAHAFLFKVTMYRDSGDKGCKSYYVPFQYQRLKGIFYSGIHQKELFGGRRNDGVQLANPDSLTFLKDGYSQIAFSFPDLDSNIISISDKKFNNKVVIIEVMGSWCPNCMDATNFLSAIYKTKHEKGLEIISLCFERSEEFSKAKQAVQRFKQQLNAPYDFLIAGTAGAKQANEKLPMLNHIMSFPTTIFIDRKGRVRKIHTGFYGPGTGEYYTKYKEETSRFIEKLLAEMVLDSSVPTF